MTCIVGVRTRTGVIIGGDSAGIGGWNLTVRRDPKVFNVGEFALGFTTSFRMGQLLGHAFKPPALPRKSRDLYHYLVTDFVDALRTALKAGGWAQATNGQESAGLFLVGVRRRLFHIDVDYQVGESADGYDAVGCGAEIARGALFASRGRLPPLARVRLALSAAERHSAGVLSGWSR